MNVTLSWGELRCAAYAGVDRCVRGLARRRTERYDQQRNWQDDIWGTLGECVVAKALGLYWPCGDADLDRGGDVGGYHVRCTDRPDKRLILHPDDPDDAQHLLVVCMGLPRFRIAGWVWGYEGKREEFWETFTGRPAYFVPQRELHELPRPLVPVGTASTCS